MCLMPLLMCANRWLCALFINLGSQGIIAGDLVDELETDETEDQNQEFLLEDDENVNS